MMNTEEEIFDVLIVEDEDLVSEMVRWSLEEAGYHVIGRAATGAEAIELTTSLEPDVIILDLTLPDVRDVEVIRYIQASRPTPIVVLTGRNTLALVERAGLAGAGAYLIKPASTQDIERAITLAMAGFNRFMALRERLDALQDELQQLRQLDVIL